MKKVLFMMFLFIGSIATSVAQNVQEVVYLKNGSIVRGIVIEQVPGVSLKIQTADGNILAYQMAEIDKILKEKVSTKDKLYKFDKSGYKGFIELGYTTGIADGGEAKIELSTSHGYQFNSYLYAGVGLAGNYYLDSKYITVPVFAHVRANILNRDISPFVDFKIGYGFGDAKGVYASPTIGYKIKSFYAGVGYVFQKIDLKWDSRDCNGINFKVGFEF